MSNREAERLNELDELQLLNAAPEKAYDAITRLSSFISGTPISLITLLTDTKQVFKSRFGFEANETPIEQSFCVHAIQNEGEFFLVEDARLDPRFRDNPQVTQDNGIVFYAGMPLVTSKGIPLGTLCVIDRSPRKLSEEQFEALSNLALQVVDLFESRRAKAQFEKTHQKLAEESASLKSIIEGARLGTWEWNVQTGEVKVNERWAEIAGYTLEELHPINIETWYKLIHPDDAGLSDEKINDCFEKKADFYDIECRLIHKDGHEVWINDRGRMVSWTKDGKPLIMSGTHTEITEKKNDQFERERLVKSLQYTVNELEIAEKKVNQSEQRFRSLVQDGSDLIAILEPDGTYKYVSPTSKQVLGFTPEEYVGKKAIDFTHPDDVELIQASLSRLKDEIRVELPPFRFKHKNQGWRWIETIATNLTQNPAVGGIVTNSRDVTDRITMNRVDIIEGKAMERSLDVDFDLIELIDEYLIGLEKVFPQSKITVLSIEGDRVFNLSSPSLSEGYVLTVNGAEIGAKAGSCGTAAYKKKRIVVSDTLSDPLWENYRDIAVEYNLRAAWSQPIFDSKKRVVAVIGVYYSVVRTPEELEIEVLDRAAALLGLILETHKKNQNLLSNNERYDLINLATNDAIYDWDVVEDVFYWGDGFYRLFGYPKTDRIFRLDDWVALTHHVDAVNHQDRWDIFVSDASQSRWTNEFRFKKADGTYAYVAEIGHMLRDEQGNPKRMIGALRDQTNSKQQEIQKRLQQEVGAFFNRDLTLSESLDQILVYLTTFAGYKVSEFWLASIDGKHLNRVATYAEDDKALVFLQKTADLKSLDRTKGLPGIVYNTQKTAILDGINKNKKFVRRVAADEAGLRTAIGVPLTYKNEVLGVLLFCSDREVEDHKEDIYYLRSLEVLLGSEIKRKQQEEEMHLLFSSAPEILAIAAPFGHFVKVNKAFCDLLGYTEEEITSQPFVNFLHPDDVYPSDSEFRETITGERKANNFLNRYRTKKGDYRWISWGSSDVFGDDHCVFCYGRDVTDFIKLQELVKSASKLSRVGSWELDLRNPSKPVMYWSPMTRELMEIDDFYDASATFGHELYEASSQELLQTKFDLLMTKGEEFDLELLMVTPGGKERWIRKIGRSEWEDGRCVRLYGSIQDIHQRREYEDSLRRLNLQLEAKARDLATSNLELEQFAYIASHDLQEPLRMISGFLTLLQSKYEDSLDDKARQYIRFAVEGSQRMRQIILDLLEFSRVGKYDGQPEEVSVNAVIEEVCKILQRRIDEKQAEVVFKNLPVFQSHRAPLFQVFQNLIENGLKYSREGVKPVIRVKAKELKKEWEFSVSDNGIGISKEYFDKIFVIFQRLHNTKDFEGTGMGLAIVKKIVDNLNGIIWVESEEGKGSTFFFTIPK